MVFVPSLVPVFQEEVRNGSIFWGLYPVPGYSLELSDTPTSKRSRETVIAVVQRLVKISPSQVFPVHMKGAPMKSTALGPPQIEKADRLQALAKLSKACSDLDVDTVCSVLEDWPQMALEVTKVGVL